MGEQTQSLKSPSVLFSFWNEHGKMIENATKCKWSPFLRRPWKWDEKHGFNNQLLEHLLIFQAADSFPLATVNCASVSLLQAYFFFRKPNQTQLVKAPTNYSVYRGVQLGV